MKDSDVEKGPRKIRCEERASRKKMQALDNNAKEEDDADDMISDQVLRQSLRNFGEKFMSMFDDYDEKKEHQEEQKRQQTKRDTTAALSRRNQESPSETSGVKQPTKATAQEQGKAQHRDEIEEIVFKGGQKKARIDPVQSAHLEAKVEAERKLFMSPKASKVHQSVSSTSLATPAKTEETMDDLELSAEDFRRMQLDVERLGATGLDRKERKKWQAAMLSRLGAQADKTPRTSAVIGKGMAKKQASQEQRKLEEAFETGMAKRKGMGRKRRAEQKKGTDWGLQELGPGFKKGVLRIKNKKKPSGGRDAGPVRAKNGRGKPKKGLSLGF